MKTIPGLSQPTPIKPGVYLNYGGSRGTLFAVPTFDTTETFNGRAILFGTASATFIESTLAPEQSFLIEDLAFQLPPLLEMVSGLGSLEVGCLSTNGSEVFFAAHDPFEDLVWVSLNTGLISEPRSRRHFFKSWTMVSGPVGRASPLYEWPAKQGTQTYPR